MPWRCGAIRRSPQTAQSCYRFLPCLLSNALIWVRRATAALDPVDGSQGRQHRELHRVVDSIRLGIAADGRVRTALVAGCAGGRGTRRGLYAVARCDDREGVAVTIS